MRRVSMEVLVSLCRRRGFVFPAAEALGGAAGLFDYGPLGAELKSNLKELWWARMVRRRADMTGIDAAILSPAQMLQATGHTEEFSDKMVDCRTTKKRYRADQVYSAKVETISDNGEKKFIGFVCFTEIEGKSLQEVGETKAKQLFKKSGLKGKSLSLPLSILDLCEVHKNDMQLLPGPDSDEIGSLTPPRNFNLMFATNLGPVEADEGTASNVAYLRPETAQGIFSNFLNVQRTSRLKIPFGIGQIGKAFRNEITPKNFTFRSREFELMEIEYFIPPENYYAKKYFQEWIDTSWKFLVLAGVDESLMHMKRHDCNQLAHYAEATTDIEFQFPFGVQELMGVANRGSFDLDCHSRCGGKSIEYLDKENYEHLCESGLDFNSDCVPKQRKYTPHCIEPSLGLDRLLLAVLTSAYHEEEMSNGETRTVLKFKPYVAPVKAVILPIVKNNSDIMIKANDIYAFIRERYNCELDTSGAVGRRYRRADEIGVPVCITVDFDSLADDCVTIRDRDSMAQRRVAIEDLMDILRRELEINQ